MFRKHWTPTYVRDRLRLRAWQRANPEAPWICPPASEFLAQWIRPTDVVAEFGAGRSTVWFASRARHVASVEHHRQWHQTVLGMLRDKGLVNAACTLVDQPEDPDQPPSNGRRLRPELATQGVEASLDALAPGTRPDIVLVDGANRDTTALWAIERVAPGGLVLIDNCNRFLPFPTRAPASLGPHAKPYSPLWEQFAQHTSGWRRVWFTDGVADTLAYFVPAAAESRAP